MNKMVRAEIMDDEYTRTCKSMDRAMRRDDARFMSDWILEAQQKQWDHYQETYAESPDISDVRAISEATQRHRAAVDAAFNRTEAELDAEDARRARRAKRWTEEETEQDAEDEDQEPENADQRAEDEAQEAACKEYYSFEEWLKKKNARLLPPGGTPPARLPVGGALPASRQSGGNSKHWTRIYDPSPMTPEQVLYHARQMYETPEQQEERERITEAPTLSPRIRKERIQEMPRVLRLKLEYEKAPPDERARVIAEAERTAKKRDDTPVYPTPHMWTIRASKCRWGCNSIALETARARYSTWICVGCRRKWRTSDRAPLHVDDAPIAAPQGPVLRTPQQLLQLGGRRAMRALPERT